MKKLPTRAQLTPALHRNWNDTDSRVNQSWNREGACQAGAPVTNRMGSGRLVLARSESTCKRSLLFHLLLTQYLASLFASFNVLQTSLTQKLDNHNYIRTLSCSSTSPPTASCLHSPFALLLCSEFQGSCILHALVRSNVQVSQTLQLCKHTSLPALWPLLLPVSWQTGRSV